MFIKYILLSMRPKQWVKNIFIFTALIFSRNVFNYTQSILIIFGFFIFSIISGAIYLLNDVLDASLDRKHPKKKNRPIAKGLLKPKIALVGAGITLSLGLGLSFWLNKQFSIVCLLYIVLQLAYIFYLKHMIILDAFAIAAGFILRIIAGAIIINVPVSSWLLICSLFLSLYLAFGKRRHELLSLGEQASKHRPVLSDYSVGILDQLITITIASTSIAYALYTLSEETVRKFNTTNLKFTIPFVLYGLFRYLYIIKRKNQGESPELILLFEKPFIINILLYICSVVIILYFI